MFVYLLLYTYILRIVQKKKIPQEGIANVNGLRNPTLTGNRHTHTYKLTKL